MTASLEQLGVGGKDQSYRARDTVLAINRLSVTQTAA
jgi:hypothetical protein